MLIIPYLSVGLKSPQSRVFLFKKNRVNTHGIYHVFWSFLILLFFKALAMVAVIGSTMQKKTIRFHIAPKSINARSRVTITIATKSILLYAPIKSVKR